MSDPSGPWTTWLDEHGPGLLLLARQWAGCQADAEDIVQEAFVRFWPNRQGVRDPAAYLYTCVRRAAVDWVRRRERQPAVEAGGDRLALEPGEPWFEPAARSAAGDRQAALEAALRALPDEQRQVVVMKIWGGLTFAAIGEVLGIPANTAASRHRYALAAMRRHLSEALIE